MNTTDFWSRFEWMLMEGLDAVRIPPLRWKLLLLCIGLIVSCVWQKAFQRGRWKGYYWLVFTQSLFIVAVSAVGVLYAARVDPTKPLPKVNPVADWSLDILYYLSLALGLFWIYRMKGVRWVAFCLVAIQEVFLYGAMFMAGMSVTGDWI